MTWQQFEDVFAKLNSSNVLDYSNDWNTMGGQVTSSIDGAKGSLTDLVTALHPGWQSSGAQALYDNVQPIKTNGHKLSMVMNGGQASGSVPLAGNNSHMAGMMAGIAAVNKEQYSKFLQHKAAYAQFTKNAGSFFNNIQSLAEEAVANGGQASGNGGTVSVARAGKDAATGATTSQFQVQVSATYADAKNGFYSWALGSAIETVQTTVTLDQSNTTLTTTSSQQKSLSPVQLSVQSGGDDPNEAARLGNAAPQGKASPLKGATAITSQDVFDADVDEYLALLRQALAPVAQAYTDAAAALPAPPSPLPAVGGKKGPNVTNSFSTTGASGPLSNVPANGSKSSNVPVSSANGANGMNNPLTSANGANANVPLSQPGANSGLTSLASAPTTTPPTGLNSGLSSGLPTGTAGLGSTLPTTGASLPGLANTGSGLPMFVPPVAGGVVPNSEFGSGLPGEFGGAGGSGLSEGALDGGLANGEFGANGELNPGATGALGEGALAAEVAPGVAASELGAAARGAPMMPFMPMSPMMGGSDGGERRRTAWLDEDEDIWAADADPAPAVIGGGEQ